MRVFIEVLILSGNLRHVDLKIEVLSVIFLQLECEPE